ncbi:MAG: zinc dependent phospholipase C family protein [Lachnospiraceae bacterium]|nr:zinc dependent phospholipase C family protein [Lachnospiraceae bacterium]
MATWVTHLMIADDVIKNIPFLCKHEFYVGNIAPDCNVENEDWTSFTPSREVTHWMENKRKVASDCDRFLHEYIEKKVDLDIKEESFLLGYLAHLITDAEFQRYIRDQKRVKASWDRIKRHPELNKSAVGMEETWDSIKVLITQKERMKDIYSLEKDYLDSHPESGYLTDIIGLEEFPDYIDYLPKGAIVRKVKVMGYMPQKEVSKYPYVGISEDEYCDFVSKATKMVVEVIGKYKGK